MPPKGILCCVRDFNKIIMRFPCWEVWEKYSEDMHKIVEQMGKINPKN